MATMKLILKTERINHGYKQSDVAKILGIEQNTYSRYETGKSNPTQDNLMKLAELYNVPIDYLLGADIKTILERAYNLGKSRGEIIGDDIKIRVRTKKENEIEK